jgi:hypothetical protein
MHFPTPLLDCRARKHSIDVGEDALPPSSSSPLDVDENDDRGLTRNLLLRLYCTPSLYGGGSGDDGDRDGMVWLRRSCLGMMLCTKLVVLEEERSFLEDCDLTNLVLAVALLL